jgi:hypothetical protein
VLVAGDFDLSLFVDAVVVFVVAGFVVAVFAVFAVVVFLGINSCL